ncbi:MAG TPA: hypothetical protein DCE41_11320, partial [Cytophagales bacterium]|nr:hypothetical protein [Cytophagales bacterium]
MRWSNFLLISLVYLPRVWAQEWPNEDSAVMLEDVLVLGRPDGFGAPQIAERDQRGTVPSALEALDRGPGLFGIQANTYPLSYRGQSGARLRVETNGARRT